MGFYYALNEKAWMKKMIFFECLNGSNMLMDTRAYKFIFFLDSCYAHRSTEDFSELSLTNTIVIFLPPNTTSLIHPCEASIIAAEKCLYRLLRIARVLEHIDMGNDHIYIVDIFQVIRWITNAWEKQSPQLIMNFWLHTALVGVHVDNVSQ